MWCWTHLFTAVRKSQSRFTGFKRPLLRAASLNNMLGGDFRHDAHVTYAIGPEFPHRLRANSSRPAEILFSHSSELQMSLVPSQQYTTGTNALNMRRGRLVFSQHTPALMWKQIQTGAVGGAQWERKWAVMLCLLSIAIKTLREESAPFLMVQQYKNRRNKSKLVHFCWTLSLLAKFSA